MSISHILTSSSDHDITARRGLYLATKLLV